MPSSSIYETWMPPCVLIDWYLVPNFLLHSLDNSLLWFTAVSAVLAAGNQWSVSLDLRKLKIHANAWTHVTRAWFPLKKKHANIFHILCNEHLPWDSMLFHNSIASITWWPAPWVSVHHLFYIIYLVLNIEGHKVLPADLYTHSWFFICFLFSLVWFGIKIYTAHNIALYHFWYSAQHLWCVYVTPSMTQISLNS